ncbi:alpha-amylase family glycosyl hydrolase [Anaerocolumna xylanovorans]|uniref:Alpha-amylase n=1 Tax=Anaerocolumna xylanovorans DSM 12503 TaxID=1121345 RepID=A0A1M7YMF3_9FIRM|nr:alpha-amylase family glycosyl hydrolase [Anaerocolumna xylanovorans]SHO53873.1 Glycosidase [Anaerocolumna xylanovorans DSM 12503]
MKKRAHIISFILILALLFTGCSGNKENTSKEPVKETTEKGTGNIKTGTTETNAKPIDDNYGTYYEVFLYSYYDSNSDGIGDINGLIDKLDYINDGNPDTTTDLGANGIWLMPIMPSDSYHKYDVKDYYDIDPQYGTLDDFKRLTAECNKRGIKIILDLVINHTSDKNPWFQSALKSLAIEPCGQEKCTHKELCREHNPYVKYYNFVEGKPAKGNYYSTGVGDWYYEGDFSQSMPDLNLDNEALRKDIEDIMTFWLDIGVHGFRLDAALHYFAEDTDKNNEVLSWLNTFIKDKNKDNYMVAEVWTNFSKYAQYYKSGIDSVFNFAFATETGVIAKTLNRSAPTPPGLYFAQGLKQVQDGIKKYNPSGIDAPFFTNHDTARAYGYFSGDIDKLKMAAGMNLTMTGNTFVYYGEEIGMTGSGKDENKRAPMYWSKNDSAGMTKGPAGMEETSYPLGSVEEQAKDDNSLYNYYKKAIALRNTIPGMARGDVEVVPAVTNNDISAVTKTYNGSKLLLLYNFSKEAKQIDVKALGFSKLAGSLDTEAAKTEIKDGVVTLPAYSIGILE